MIRYILLQINSTFVTVCNQYNQYKINKTKKQKQNNNNNKNKHYMTVSVHSAPLEIHHYYIWLTTTVMHAFGKSSLLPCGLVWPRPWSLACVQYWTIKRMWRSRGYVILVFAPFPRLTSFSLPFGYTTNSLTVPSLRCLQCKVSKDITYSNLVHLLAI